MTALNSVPGEQLVEVTRAAAAPVVVVVGGQREVVVVLATEAELLVGPVDHVQSRTVTEKDFVVRYENR